MKTTVSYKVQILHFNKISTQTFQIYRKAVCYIIKVIQENYDDISSLEYKLEKQNFVEHLIHNTSKNVALYDFDRCFYKLPIYLLRSAIAKSLGNISSYVSNGNDVWDYKVSKHQRYMPCLYNGNMFSIDLDNYTAKIKLYINNDWVWYKVKLCKTDVDYLLKKGCNFKSPVMVRNKGKIYLQFNIDKNVELSKKNDRITSVDLGLNHDAVCVVMNSDGTVLGRKFIDCPSEKDHMENILSRIKSKQSCGMSVKNDWSYYKMLNHIRTNLIASKIVEYAHEHSSNVIVFEHLDMQRKKAMRGKSKQKISLWHKNNIQNVCEYKAHLLGMRIARVFSKGTSMFAFDGSGKVIRGREAGFKNNKLCKFSSGKIYNADLSAAYNIGARYFIKLKYDKLSQSRIKAIQAKVPALSTRTTCTLDTLIKLNAELCA